MGGISIWQLLIILAIIVLLFGTKKLRNIGADLGGAVRGFKKAMGDEDKSQEAPQAPGDKTLDNKAAPTTMQADKAEAEKPKV